MKQKAFVLQNKGMNRDLSISKATESSAYENHNIRVLSRDHDTMLSVTNERGNKLVILEGRVSDNLRVTEDEEIRITEDELYRTVGDGEVESVDFEGILIGWNVLNNIVILFTNEGTTDRIYRVKHEDKKFYSDLLFEGHLGFELTNPIESVVYYETEEIQKIYWVDGKNVLRFMNFAEEPDKITGLFPWQISATEYDNTYFDSNRAVDFGVQVSITKDNSGNTRPNGVVQYLLTYYNKHGQESGYVWISDLVYLSPVASGGAADGTNNNSVTLDIRNLDTRFSHFRVYSVFRSALNGTTTAYIVFDGKTGQDVKVVDNNSHLTAIDASQLLYLGSVHAVASTITHKDQTLFLGDLSSVGRDYQEVEDLLKSEMIDQNVPAGTNPWECKFIEFVRTEGEDNIPHEISTGSYTYNSQLVDSSSQITSFKGGEKYRFGLVFHKKDGTMTDAFWIGDKVNDKYPIIGDTSIQRIIAKCTLPASVVQMMEQNDYMTAQLMIAEATYADRSIKAQGIVCPTVFNVWNRYMNRVYSASSWMMRPRNSEYSWRHFDVIDKSTKSTGEIDCNYWEGVQPHPYYVLNNYRTTKDYAETFEGQEAYNYAIVIYHIWYDNLPYAMYWAGATVVLVKPLTGNFSPSTFTFSGNPLTTIEKCAERSQDRTIIISTPDCEYKITNFASCGGKWSSFDSNKTKEAAWSGINKAIHDKYNFLGSNELVNLSTFYTWCGQTTQDSRYFFNPRLSGQTYTTITDAVNDTAHGLGRWNEINEVIPTGTTDDYLPSYYKKHLMFIDENVITLNSPEIEYEAVSFDKVDGYKFRIVGIAKIDDNYSDYTVEATPGKLAGGNLIHEKLKKELIAWPLWKEFGLDERHVEEGGDPNEEDDLHFAEEDIKARDSYDYLWGGAFVRYWLRMWNHSDKISGFTDYQNDDYSRLIRKVFANARYSNKTVYNDFRAGGNMSWECTPDSVRIFNYTSSQYVSIDVGKNVGIENEKKSRYYEGIVNDSLMPPRNQKYPVLFDIGTPNPEQVTTASETPYLYLSDPVSITYSSTPHAVISLPSGNVVHAGKLFYEQTILPYMDSSENTGSGIPQAAGDNTGALIPWIKNTREDSYPYLDYSIDRKKFEVVGENITASNKYLYIGELYADLEDSDQIRYGGTSDAAIQNNRFIIAGPQMLLSDMVGDGEHDILIANQGDTYIQRWDCLKTKPYSSDCVNNVIDITSVMLETHINIDGRTDLQRGTSYIASIDAEKWGSLNPVYTQHNNFITQRDLDEDFNLDEYRSSITWTLEKHDSEDVDAWSHITLASSLKLDGDKGFCRALRRFRNNLIAFQDRGISEILFNSRTQLTTTDGVPVEIANSGNVDGKRYFTNKYGCTNKWSIVEGKNALYFVDNINKAFCAASISERGAFGIEPLSMKLGFSAWFREINDTEPWRPIEFNNIVSYYDKIHSDVYLVRNTDDNMPCLVYSENLGAFTSFFDYSAVLMMANVEDRFLSYKNHHLWLQNEGLYCNFFGHQYDYWMQYRVTPEPYSDKIWTNIDYRADFYQVLDEEGKAIVPEENLINGDTFGEMEDLYKEWETFTDYKVWDEYQTTGFVPFAHDHFDRDDVRKKFRIWRLTVPRALKEGTNKYGMDRIRNPWINLMFRKSMDDNKNLMQLHDIVVKYFE